MSQRRSAPPYNEDKFRLNFETTERLIALHWIASVLPFTVLLVTAYLFSLFISFSLTSILRTVLSLDWRVVYSSFWFIGLIPLTLSVANNQKWDITYRVKSKLTNFICVIILLLLCIAASLMQQIFFLKPISLIIISFVLLNLCWGIIRFKILSKYQQRSRLTAYFIFIFITWLVGLSFPQLGTVGINIFVLGIGFFLTILLMIVNWQNNYNTQGFSNQIKANPYIIFLSAFFIFLWSFQHLISPIIPSTPYAFVAAFGFIILFILILIYTVGIRLTIYRLRSYARNSIRAIRHDRARAKSFPVSAESNTFNRFWAFLTRIVSLDPLSTGLVAIFFVAVLVIGFEFDRIQKTTTSSNEFVPLLNAFLLGGIILFVGSASWAFINVILRQRYLVLPLRPSVRNDPALQSLSETATQSLVEQLQRIGTLLTLRQVENVSAGTNEVMALFVTSGQEQQFMSELQSLLSFDYSALNASTTNLWAATSRFAFTIARYFAEITVSGTVERSINGEIEIVIELAKRNKIVLVARRPLPRTASDTYDETRLGPIAYQLATEIVLKLGQGRRIASRVESLEYFLEGLLASSNRNWWAAIEAYQKACTLEEAERGNYGIGYYHIGSTLILQGEMGEGKRYLEMAEAQGLSLAELQYMLALVELSYYWDNLEEESPHFKQIIRRCENALQLRSLFPEVLHLMGAAHYQLGKLQNRERTKAYEAKANSDETQEQRNYKKAVRFFRKSRNHYNASYARLYRIRKTSEQIQLEAARIFRETVTATHRLADAMRALERYSEAEGYYDDVLNVVPANISTLVDLSKTYCLAKSWQRADDFIRQQVMNLPEAEWEPHVNLHAGWALAGGTAVELLLFKSSETLKDNDSYIDYIRKATTNLRQSVMHIDYAIYLRPQYMTQWEQTDWQSPLFEAYERMHSSPRIADNLKIDLYNKPLYSRTLDPHRIVLRPQINKTQLSPEIDQLLEHQLLWLAWRMDSRNYDDSSSKLMQLIDRNITMSLQGANIDKDEAAAKAGKYEEYPSPELAPIYIEMKAQHRLFAMFLAEVEESGRVASLPQRLRRLRFSAIALDMWKEAERKLTIDSQKNEAPTFCERWEVDVYAETALFTVRVLVEGGAYETAYEVANKSNDKLNQWINRWRKAVIDEGQATYFTFSPLVLRYQISTLYAWKAYCACQMHADMETRARLLANQPLVPDQTSEMRIQEDIDESFKYLSRHPLALFVQAILYRRQGQNNIAIDELHRLLTSFAPFDPNKQIADWQPSIKHRPEHPTPFPIHDASVEKSEENRQWEKYKKLSLRQRMARYEQVSGNRQFEYVVNLSTIHQAIADLHIRNGEIRLSVEHLISAVTLSQHWDIDADLLLSIARLLERQSRFRDADAVVDALNSYRHLLEVNTMSTTRILEARILNCIIHARLGEYAQGRDLGKILEQELRDKTRTVNNSERYKKRVASHYRLVAVYDRLIDELNTNKIVGLEIDKFLTSPYEQLLLDGIWQTANVTVGTENALQKIIKLGFDPEKIASILPSLHNPLFPPSEQPRYGNQNFNIDIIRRESPVLHIDWNITIRLFYVLAKDAARIIEHVCQLDNNLVYNHIQSNVRETKDVVKTNILINPLADTRLEARINRAIRRMKTLHDAATPFVSEYKQLYKENLANYHDTNAWRIFRSLDFQNSNYTLNLQDSISELNTALFYNPQSAIVNYHMARIYLRLLEHFWQSIPSTMIEDRVDTESNKVNEYLSQALRYWIAARDNDQNRRLGDSLGWLGRRIQRYRSAWDRRHIRTFSGSIDNSERREKKVKIPIGNKYSS